MRLKFKKGDIPSARMICVDLLGPPDGEDFDGNGYGSVDIAEILSGAYDAQQKRITEQDATIESLKERNHQLVQLAREAEEFAAALLKSSKESEL